jgi:hypothetical protein
VTIVREVLSGRCRFTSRNVLAGMIAPLVLAGAALASGAIVFDGSIGTGKPPRTLQGRVMLRFKRDTRPRSFVTTVPGPTGAIRFDRPLFHYVVKRVKSEWQSWSNGYRGSVYASASRVKITLPPGTTAFYFYAEPNDPDWFTITATSGGVSSGRIRVFGWKGAKFFGFVARRGHKLTSVVVSSTDVRRPARNLFGGFAIGEFGIHKR